VTETTQEAFAVDCLRNQRIPVCGGELAADVYLPVDAPPAPALLTLVPYSKDAIAGVGSWEANHYFASRGFPSLVIDMRGLGCSSGAMRAPFDRAEADDGVAAVEWAAAQSWSDGTIGMWGVSYSAITTLRTAARAPAALKAIVPIIGCLDPERDFIHPAGRHGFLASLGVWGLTMLTMQLLPPLGASDEDWEERWQTRLNAEPHALDLVRHGPGDPVWRSRAIDASSIAAASFCVAGARDMFCDGAVRAFEQIRAPKKLLFGPWMHTVPHEAPTEAVDFLPLMLEWWQRWLGPANRNGQPSAAVSTVFFGGGGGWRQQPDWSSPVELCLYPSLTGTLDSQSGAEGVVRYHGNPLVGVAAGLWAFPGSGHVAPGDQSQDDASSMSFTTDVLDSDLIICGRPSLDLNASDFAAARSVSARLCDVAPSGWAEFICPGAVAGGEEELRIEFNPTAYVVKAGHRLRLVLATAEFPRVSPEEPRLLEVVVGGAAPTTLSLPTAADLGSPADLAAPRLAANPLVVAAAPFYEVERDDEYARVTVGDTSTAWTTGRDQLIASTSRSTAYVDADRPAEASVHSRGELDIATEAQGKIHIVAELTVVHGHVEASGTVSVDGRETFARRWRVDGRSQRADAALG
jgi:putative CocE/NonD family hydrolase